MKWAVELDTSGSHLVLIHLFLFPGFTDLNSQIPLECYAVFKT